MSVFGLFLNSIAMILHFVINAYVWVIIAAALISWVSPDPRNKIVQLLWRPTYPAYLLVRKTRIPTIFGNIDLTPIIIILALQFLDLFVVRLLIEISVNI